MANLFNSTVADTFYRLIQMGNSSNSGVGVNALYLQDGGGNNLPLLISTTGVNVSGLFYINGSSGICVSNLFNITGRLIEIATSEGYQLTSTYYNSGILSSGNVLWPDGGTGLYITTNFNTTFFAVDGYTLTYGNGVINNTITQSGVLRNISGYVTGASPLSIQ